jgi:hypothetical protein
VALPENSFLFAYFSVWGTEESNYVQNQVNKVGGDPVEYCALLIPFRRDVRSKLVHCCDAAYSKLPVIQHVWGKRYALHMNLIIT